ncbi:hypothetical protein [uncultured Ruminococcus sp.]|uniref:hypothetical protein n=1 Tax=uncultured Ruminococcus sp. TaxID=165186 RepID=UPI0025DB8ED4|nr:hypothetical protein [uncultured Ruminococcus sp.]
MVNINENDLDNGIHSFDDAEQEKLYYKMLHTLFYRGFYAADNKDCDPCHFLTVQEQSIYKSALDFYNEIPF